MTTLIERPVIFLLILFYLFLFLGPEATAKSLPMKKVQTVETVWVPMDSSEVDDSEEVFEAVELEEGQKGAVPLFKENPVTEPQVVSTEDSSPKGAVQELPGVQVKSLPPGSGDQRPIIQVIYQGDNASQKEKPATQKPVVQTRQPDPPHLKPPSELFDEPKMTKPEAKDEKIQGDVYNFYFNS